jgi:hypothetical protein
VDTAQEFYASDGDGSGVEVLEAWHGAGSGFDPAVILLDEVVQVLRERNLMRVGSKPSVRISRTARCEAA